MQRATVFEQSCVFRLLHQRTADIATSIQIHRHCVSAFLYGHQHGNCSETCKQLRRTRCKLQLQARHTKQAKTDKPVQTAITSRRSWLLLAHLQCRSVVLNRGERPPPPRGRQQISRGASPYALHSMKSVDMKFTNKYICFNSLFKISEA